MKRIAIIGAGPSGLSQLRSFRSAEEEGADIPEIVCFEKQSTWGGLWNYSWRTGTDNNGEPVHNSMYRYLWSNGPKECLEFGDYSFDEHFKKSIPSFPPREVLKSYILGRAETSDLSHMVKFNHVVRNISISKDTGKFNLRVTDIENNTDLVDIFDIVIIATGHFSVPNVPYFEGIENFMGRVMHSHDFRDAAEFNGKRLLIIGSSYSAEDIALQSIKYGAKEVICSYRSAPMGFRWPSGIEEFPIVERFDGTKSFFCNGSNREIDAVIMCTGYLHHFPFLQKNLRLNTNNSLYPGQLYKGIFWLDNPNLIYLGMQDQYYTLNMFDAQSWYARDVLLDRIQLPSRESMEKDIKTWMQRERHLKNPTQEIEYQTDYCKDLVELTDYKIDYDLISKQFIKWEKDKDEDIVAYRDRSFISPVTGTQAPEHHTSWWDEMDDSYGSFVGKI